MTVGLPAAAENEYEDPIAHFTEVARQMTEAQKKKTAPLILSIAHDKQMPLGTDSRKNLGHVVFSYLYHELELDYFITNRRRYIDA